MRITTLGGRRIEQYSSPNIGGQMTAHNGLVLHSAEGSYRGTIAWQLNPDQQYSDGTKVTTSSTFIVGRQDGEWAQMVDSDRVAWCQRSGSLTWMSIELAGFAPSAPTSWQIWACAQLLAWAHDEYGVPIRATGDTSGGGLGHHSMDNDTSVQWGHDACPGAGVIGAKNAIVTLALNIGEEEDMTPEQALQLAWSDARLEALGNGRDDIRTGLQGAGQDVWLVRHLKAMDATLNNLANRPPATVDVEALATAIVAQLPAGTLSKQDVQDACEAAVRLVNQDAATP